MPASGNSYSNRSISETTNYLKLNEFLCTRLQKSCARARIMRQAEATTYATSTLVLRKDLWLATTSDDAPPHKGLMLMWRNYYDSYHVVNREIADSMQGSLPLQHRS